MIYEYKVITIPYNSDEGFAQMDVTIEKTLNSFAAKGWELVTAVFNKGTYAHTVYLRREKSNSNHI